MELIRDLVKFKKIEGYQQKLINGTVMFMTKLTFGML